MLTIHGNRTSIPCRKVLYLCHLLELPYRWVEKAFGTGELKEPGFRALHPAGKVPVLEDNGFVLFESEAICRYLCALHPGPVLPADIRARAIVDQWSFFCAQHIGLAMGKVLFNTVVAPRHRIPVDERSLREGREWLARYLPIVDKRLEESACLAGDTVTLADLSLLVYVERAPDIDLSLSPYPALERWWERLQDEPFYRAAHDDRPSGKEKT